MRVLFFADRRLERDWFLRHLDDLAHLVGLNLHTPADLVAGWLPAVLLNEPPAYAHELVDRLHHVHRNADRTSLVRNSTRYRLADPPCCIGAELEALAVIELLDGANKADITFLDEIQERHPTPNVLLGNADDEAEVGFSQTLLGAEAFVLHALEVRAGLLLVGEQLVGEIIRRRRQAPVSAHRLGGP